MSNILKLRGQISSIRLNKNPSFSKYYIKDLWAISLFELKEFGHVRCFKIVLEKNLDEWCFFFFERFLLILIARSYKCNDANQILGMAEL